METTKYVPVKGDDKKSYLFQAEVEEDEDGRWSAWVPVLPGCATWGYSKDEAITNLHDAVELYVEDMIEAGDALPTEGVQVVNGVMISVTA